MMKRGVWILAVAALLLVVGGGTFFVAKGCGEEMPKQGAVPAKPVPIAAAKASVLAPRPAEPAPEENETLLPLPRDGATITGTVKVTNPPRRKKIKLASDPKCDALHPEPLLTEDIVVDQENRAQWALVSVKAGASGKYEAPKTPVVIDQKGCHYEPHVLGMVAGQEVLIRNSDDLLHNIHALPMLNREFNIGQPSKGMEEKKSFTQPEYPPFVIKCDIHAWMGARAAVFRHPFFAVTGPGGKYEIQGLPPGKYTLEAWHELYKPVTQEVEIQEKESKILDFTLADRNP